jgi:hypothetical protein
MQDVVRIMQIFSSHPAFSGKLPLKMKVRRGRIAVLSKIKANGKGAPP